MKTAYTEIGQKVARTRLGMSLALLAALGVSATAGAHEIPAGIPYQGVLELGGQAVTGDKQMRFQVVNGAEDVLWQGDRTVSVRQGRFSILLIGGWNGKGLHQLVAEGQDLFMKVGIYEGSDYVMFDGMQRFAPVPYAMTPAFGGVPIGTVIDWFGDAGNIPYGYMVANGDPVIDPDSPMDGVTLPNLVNQFVRGRPATGNSDPATWATTGGLNAHAHSSNTSHTHSANHDHPVATTAGAGAHSHVVLTYNTSNDSWRDGAGTSLDSNQSDGLDRAGVGSYALLRRGSDSTITAYSSAEAGHSHASSTPARNVTTTSGGTTTTPTTVSDNVPEFVGLLKLVRIK